MTAPTDRAGRAAAALIARRGKTVLLRRGAPAGYDPATGAVAETGAAVPVKALVEADAAEQTDGQIRRGDRLLTLAAAGLDGDPRPGDRVSLDGAGFTLTAVDATWSGERRVLWHLRLRR